MRRRLAAVLAVILFLVLAGTGVSSAYWNTKVAATATVGVASLAANCQAPSRLTNGSFEVNDTGGAAVTQAAPANVSPWKTTDTTIEIWSDGAYGVPAPVGKQFAELNANVAGTLYQDIATTPGQTIRWSLLHRARVGTDVMEVQLGAPGAPVAQARFTDDTSAWGRHEAVYTVPAGQTTTRFSMTAISTGSGNASIGNFVDDVSFGSGPCLSAASAVTNTTRATGTAQVGDVLEYTTTVSNTGGSQALSTELQSTLPTGLTFVPGSIVVAGTARTDATGDDQGDYTAAGRSITGRLGLDSSASSGGSVAPDQSLSIKFRATIAASAVGSSVSYSAAATYADYLAPNWPMTITTAPLTTPVASGADVAVTALATPTPTAGSATDSAFTFTVTNNGPLDAAGLTVRLSVPSTVTITTSTRTTNSTGTATSACVAVTGNALARDCVIGGLVSGQSRVVSISGTVAAATAAGSAVNVVATSTTTSSDYVSTNNTATNTATVTGETTPPTAPTNLAITGTTATTVGLSWTAATDNVAVTKYEIYRAGIRIGTVNAPTLTFTDTGLVAGTPYIYTVKAVDAAGNVSAASNAVAATTVFSANTYYSIGYPLSNAGTAKCFDINGTANSSLLEIDNCSTTSTSQRWSFAQVTGNYYDVSPQSATTRSWDLVTSPGANFTQIRVQTTPTPIGTRMQFMPVTELNNGVITYRFVNAASGLCLDINGQSTTAGTVVQQYTCNGSAAQSFSLTRIN